MDSFSPSLFLCVACCVFGVKARCTPVNCDDCCDYTCKTSVLRLAYFSTGKIDASGNFVTNSSASYYLPAVYLAATLVNDCMNNFIYNAKPDTNTASYGVKCSTAFLPFHYLHITEVYTKYETSNDISHSFADLDDLVNIKYNSITNAMLYIADLTEPWFNLTKINFPFDTPTSPDSDPISTTWANWKIAVAKAQNADFIAILGPNTNGEADLLPPFATGFQVVQVAHAVDSPTQSQTGLFPSFFRISLPNTVYVDVTANLIQQLTYNNIAILVEGTSDGFPKVVSTKTMRKQTTYRILT